MIKRILVPLDPTEYTDNAIRMASFLARKSDAEVTGMVVLDIPGIEKSIGPVPLGALSYAKQLEASKEKEAKEHIESLLNKFKEKCEEKGLRHREAERQGVPTEHIISESLYYDALMMGMRTNYDFETHAGLETDTIKQLMHHMVTPIYAVPKELKSINFETEKLNVLIAFDGSLSAGAALQRFGALASPDLMDVTVITAEKDREKAKFYLEQAEAYLKVHGFEQAKTDHTGLGIVECVKKNYLDWAHVIVVGDAHKKGMDKTTMGELAEFLLKADEKPLLIAP